MNTLGVDIETFSSVDIRESGVYAYADAPDFQILLVGYRLNDGNVEMIDIANMTADEAVNYIEDWYPDFWKALTDTQTKKDSF